jgi:hypothetical protein
MPSTSISLKSILMLSYLRLGVSNGMFPSGFPTISCINSSSIQIVLLAWQSYPPWLNHRIIIGGYILEDTKIQEKWHFRNVSVGNGSSLCEHPVVTHLVGSLATRNRALMCRLSANHDQSKRNVFLRKRQRAMRAQCLVAT